MSQGFGFDIFGGIEVYTNPFLTKPAPRTWVDIVLSWNPCNDFKKPDVPSDEVYIIQNEAIVVHPMMLDTLRHHFGVTVRDPRGIVRLAGA
jgi:hypothetical protein